MGELAASLAALYIALCLAAGVQVLRIIYYGHNPRSFQLAFLVLVFIWTLLRALFFGTESTHQGVLVGAYWIALDVQFATFSLLVTFYAYLHYKAQRTLAQHRNYIIAVYVLVNVAGISVTVSQVAVACHLHACKLSKDMNKAHHLYSGCDFLLLLGLLAYYGRLLTRSAPSGSLNYVLSTDASGSASAGLTGLSWGDSLGTAARSPSLRPVSQVASRLMVVTVAVWTVFASRCAYNFVSFAGRYQTQISDDHGSKHVGVGVFLLFLWWEILPTCMVLLYWHKIPETKVRGCCAFLSLSSVHSSSRKHSGIQADISSTSAVDPMLSKAHPADSDVEYGLRSESSDEFYTQSDAFHELNHHATPKGSAAFPSILSYTSDDSDGLGLT